MKFAGREFKPSKSNCLVLRKINAKTITLDTGGDCLTESFETEEECKARWSELTAASKISGNCRSGTTCLRNPV